MTTYGKDPADDGPEVDIIRRETGRSLFYYRTVINIAKGHRLREEAHINAVEHRFIMEVFGHARRKPS